MAFELAGLLVLLGVAFVPSLYYMARIRRLERYHRNPLLRMLFAFAWGAVAAIIIAIFLELWLPTRLDAFRPARFSEDLFMAVIIAPFAEELAKVIGVVLLSGARQWEEEDGLVYGATVGLGFAATENLIYELNALQAGLAAWLLVAILRILTSTLLHASASAMSGWGVSRLRSPGGGEGTLAFLALLVTAMVMHALFNLFASLGQIYPDEAGATLLSLILVFVFAGLVYRFTRRKIQQLDRRVPYARAVYR